jgi:heterodisulfide reductase subunit A-like polyferredoxin
MEKWNSRQPYYIVAGPNYGVMSYDGLVGPDYNYSKADLDVIEPYGVNAMVYVPRKGTYINSNQTAKQRPVSALSKVHVRELVIYLQNEIEAMLENYQWELNTQTLRDTIKTKADTILEKIKLNGGVYDYINVCDGTNNTPEVIDNEMVILDTSIEPARGAGKMVQRLTIHKTGGISSLTK